MGDAANDPNKQFSTEHLANDLKGRSVRGGVATTAAQIGKTVLDLGALVVLARILTPADFGLIAMVVAVTGLITMFKDLGLSTATVQRAEITHEQVNALFWINIGLGLFAALLTAALAPAIAAFYNEPRLTAVAVALAGAILISGTSVQHQALLKRQMRFFAIGVATVVSVAVGVTVAICTAFMGFGYWALVLQQLATAVALTAGVWVASPWRPSRPAWKAEGLKPMLSFGGHLTGFRFVNYFARHADDILIGRYLGAGPLGLYDKAYKLLLAPLRLIRNPISSVVLPALSRLQNNPQRYRAYTRQALAIITFLSMPVITFCFAEAQSIILLVLGPQWIESAAIFRILAVAAMIQSFNMVTGWSYMSLGQTDRWLRWGLFYAAVIVTSFIVGLNWGVLGVAIAYTVANYILLIPSFAYCFKSSHLEISQVFSAVWKPAASAMMASAILLLCSFTFGIKPPQLLLDLVISGLLFVVVYLAGWIVLPGGRAHLLQLAQLANEIRR